MNFKTVFEAINWLEHQPRFKEKVSLYDLKLAYNDLEIDVSKVKKIHVAGTNGKGSTSAFLTNILVGNNKRVGTFTSPYLVKFNERIKINNIDISDDDLLKHINQISEYNEDIFAKYQFRLSFFELLTLMMFKYFSDKDLDVMVIEVGIGGRLDATNIIDYDVSIITSIGFDHMKQLGNTLKEIANEKIQILKPNGYLISAVTDDIKSQFIKYAQKVKAKFLFIKPRDVFAYSNHSFYYKDQLFEISLLGDYQRLNALLAVHAIKYLYNFPDEQIKPFLMTTKWPGRFEEIKQDVYLDGAHNIPGIEALLRNINYIFRDKKITILFSALKDKEISEMLDLIKAHDYNIILTDFPDQRFMSLEGFVTDKITYQENSLEVLKSLVLNKAANEVIFVTGSLHFIGYVKQNIK